MATLILGRDGMGEGATEDDFQSYVALVESKLDTLCGFPVAIVTAQPRDVQVNRIWADEDEKTTINEALIELWDEWCSV